MEILQCYHFGFWIFSSVHCLSDHGKCTGSAAYNHKDNCEIALFHLSSITERMSFLLVQTTTVSVFFSEKCNSVS